MNWFESFRSRKDVNGKSTRSRAVTPVCNSCRRIIECMNVSIGDVIEEQGACLYSGSEGSLYQPLYDGSICTSCGSMLCDDCVTQLSDKYRCPRCGGMLRTITEKRLPRAGK
jgi:hypothetical protein